MEVTSKSLADFVRLDTQGCRDHVRIDTVVLQYQIAHELTAGYPAVGSPERLADHGAFRRHPAVAGHAGNRDAVHLQDCAMVRPSPDTDCR